MFKAKSDWSDGIIRSANSLMREKDAVTLSTEQISILTEALRRLAPGLPSNAYSLIDTILYRSDFNRRIRPERVYMLCEIFNYLYCELRNRNQGFPVSIFSSITNVPAVGDEAEGSIAVNFSFIDEAKLPVVRRYVSRLNRALTPILRGAATFSADGYLSLTMRESVQQKDLYPLLYLLTQRAAFFSFSRNCLKYGSPT